MLNLRMSYENMPHAKRKHKDIIQPETELVNLNPDFYLYYTCVISRLQCRVMFVIGFTLDKLYKKSMSGTAQ